MNAYEAYQRAGALIWKEIIISDICDISKVVGVDGKRDRYIYTKERRKRFTAIDSTDAQSPRSQNQAFSSGC